MVVIENRATTVLYNFLKSNRIEGFFLLPANVCPIVPLTFLKAGVNFEFIDIDSTHAMDKQLCLLRIEDIKYTGFLFIQPYGKVINNDVFYQKIKSIRKELFIIDDRCLCMPRLTIEPQTNVDLELYSTGYAKYVELSYGGWGIINNNLNYDRSNLLFSQLAYDAQMSAFLPMINKNQHFDYIDSPWLDTEVPSFSNEYFDTIKSNLDKISEQKKILNGIYSDMLPSFIMLGSDYNDWRFMVKVSNRQKILDCIFKKGFFAGTNFPSVANLFNKEIMPIAEKEQSMLINLFNDFRVNEIQAITLARIINEELQK